MTDRVFETLAPKYWLAGLPAIPLRERQKAPVINQWSLYGRQMPSQSEQMHWLASYPNGNIGLPLGPFSGVCVIDIDTEDPELTSAILEILPESPWKRVGKKGMALAYKFEQQRNFKLRGPEGGMILEFLGLGNQVALPGSIHPDTGLPYTSTTNLWEVLDQLPCLGEDIEDKLRGLLGTKGFELGAGGRSSPVDIVPAGERDVQMIRHAGYLARVVLGIDRSAQFSLMEAMGHMHHWVETYTVKVSGDAMDPGKGVAKLLEFLLRDLEKGRTMPQGWDANMTDEVKEHPTIARMFEMNATQRWDLVKAREWLTLKVLENPDDDRWIMARINELITEIAKDEHFPGFEFRVLIQHIIQKGGPRLNLKKSDLLIAFKEAKKGVVADSIDDTHAQIARTVLETLQREGEIRFDHGQFWQWSGSCFSTLDEEALYMHVANNVKDNLLVRRHSDYNAIVEVLQRMCKGELIQCEERGINFANGFVDEELRVQEHDPKYGATFTLPFEYDRTNASRCNRWLEFLHDCWGHEPDFEQRVAALQEMFAVTLFKIAPRYQRAFLLFGRAGTGKTQILQVLRSMLPPDAVAELGPQHWGERFSLTALIGKAANICGELPENGMISGNVFKEVIEGSPCNTEFKGQDSFVFVPECAHWFASNYLAVSRDTTRGFIRRWLVLDFNKPVPEEDRIENLAESIVADEREAIAAWALEGLRRVLDARGFTLPKSHHFRMNQMRRINNSVQAFLEDARNIALVGGGEMRCRELYDLYVFHMSDVGRNSPVSFERFMQMLEDLDLDVDHRVDPTGTADYVVRGVVKVDRLAA